MKTSIVNIIIRTRQQYAIDFSSWKEWSIFLARLHIKHAPMHVRILFIGQPSNTSEEACKLAEIFTVLFLKAEDAALATNTPYKMSDVWSNAVRLWEAYHG